MRKIFPVGLILIAAFVLMIASCRRPDSQLQGPDPSVTPIPGVGEEHIEALRGALALEDQALRQMQEDMMKYDVTWPFSEVLKGSRMRILKIESIFRDNNVEPLFTPLPTAPTTSLEDALKKDAAMLDEVCKHYQKIEAKKYTQLDPRLIPMLDMDAKTYQQLVADHDNVKPADLKEYGAKRYAPRQP